MKRVMLVGFLLVSTLVFAEWNQGEYVDKFGDPTGNKYMVSDILEGYFSNSATSDSPLLVLFFADNKEGVRFKLYEYESQIVREPYKNNSYEISVKDNNGYEYTFYGSQYGESIYFKDKDTAKIIDILSAGDCIFYVRIDDYGVSSYLFKMPFQGNLKELL